MGRRLTEEQRKKILQKRKQNRLVTIKIIGIFVLILLVFIGGRIIISKIFSNDKAIDTNKEIVDESNKESNKESDKEIKKDTSKEMVKDTQSEGDISVDVLNNGDDNAKSGKIENKYANEKISKADLDKKIASLPDILKRKIELYPESETTVIRYQEAKEKNISKDISNDFENSKLFDRKVKLPYLNQWDERWGYEKVDDQYIAISGCGPTSLSMVYSGLTGDISKNPYEMAKFAFENGWYDKQGGKYELFNSGAQKLGLKSREIKSNEDSIKKNLDDGNVIVALVVPNGYNDFSQTGGHYIILTDYNEENKLVIYDVNSYNNTNKTWSFDRVLSQTKVLYSISK